MKKKSFIVKSLLRSCFLSFYFLSFYPAIVSADVSDTTGDIDAATWELYTSTVSKKCMVYSDDKSILWVGTDGGLEKRDPETGELIRLYTTLDGLPGNSVLAVAADGNGGIWVGTWTAGLAHLSADEIWTVYNTENSGLPSNGISVLLPDDRGGIWIGGPSLVYLSADGIWTVYNTKNSGLPDNIVNTLMSDGKGGIWVGTGGLYFWDNYTNGGLAHLSADGIWTVYNSDNSGLPCNMVHALIPDDNGGVWIGTGKLFQRSCGGLAHLSSDGVWTVYNTENSSLSSDYVNALLSDGKGGIWVGTSKVETGDFYSPGGLAHLSTDGTWTVYDTENSSLPDNGVNTLISDRNGGIWIGTGWPFIGYYDNYQGRLGLARLSADGKLIVYGRDNSSLPSDIVNDLASDDNGGVWILARHVVLTHLSADGSMVMYDRENSGLISDANNLVSDGKGGLWFGTSNIGLAHLSADGVWRVYNTENSGLPDNYVYSLISDSNGGVWIGTQNKGLAHLSSDGPWRVYTTDNSNIPDNGVFPLTSDHNGGLWVRVLDSGIAYLSNEGIWSVYNTENSDIPDNNVDSLVLDSKGGIWISIPSQGLAYRSADGIWTSYTTKNSSLPDNRVLSLISDGRGGVWGNVNVGELFHLSSEGIWTIYDNENSGLPSYGISSLVSDSNDGIWAGFYYEVAHLSSDKTVVKVDLNNAVYSIGDHLTLDITLNGRESVDLYVLAFYPDGDFQSVISPYYFSRINTVKAYREAIDLSGQQTLRVLDETIESSQKPGAYTYYGIAVKAGLDPFNTQNWLYSTFKTYNLR